MCALEDAILGPIPGKGAGKGPIPGKGAVNPGGKIAVNDAGGGSPMFKPLNAGNG